MSDSLKVLHVVGDDTPPARLDTLAALLGGRAACSTPRLEPGSQRVVWLGRGSVDCPGPPTVERLPAPLGIGRLAAGRLQRVLPTAQRTVVHVWSAKALRGVISAVRSSRHVDAAAGRGRRRLLMDVEVPLDFCRLTRGRSRHRSEVTLRFVCPSEAVRRRLVAAGVSGDECVLIRDAVDLAAVNTARRSEVRSRLDLAAEHAVVLVVPPVLRETGALVAAWATMLLGQVRPDVRLIVPDEGRGVDRVARLVESCRQGWMLRLAGRRFALCELAAAADLAVYLPTGTAPLGGLLWALAAASPIVASAVPAITELLADGRNAWLCRAESPQDAARRMLHALENPQLSQRQAASARSQASQIFSRRRMIEQYAQAYENLLADRRIADGIEDAALIR